MSNCFKMESDSALHGDVPDGAEMSPLIDNPAETIGEDAVNNIAANESEAVPAVDNGGVLI